MEQEGHRQASGREPVARAKQPAPAGEANGSGAPQPVDGLEPAVKAGSSYLASGTAAASSDSYPAELAPWSMFAPHRGKPYAFFIESGGRSPAFVGSRPSSQLRIDRQGHASLWEQGGWRSVVGDPIAAVADFVECSAAAPVSICGPAEQDLPQQRIPRTVGYLSYDLAPYIERLPLPGPDPVGAPLALLSTYDRLEAWRPGDHRTTLIDYTAEPGNTRYDCVEPFDHPLDADPGVFDTSRKAYEAGFERIKRAISAGEIYQANLSRLMSFRLPAGAGSAEEIYCKLRRRQPMPYAAFLDCGDFKILSNSPECFIEVHGEDIATFPIKGTRPRRTIESEDEAMKLELSRDAKEMAEHVMIVDLERNDLGRVCHNGSIEVISHARVESFATLHHMVSEIRGRLRDGIGFGKILRACFPGGSISGAPKIKAMEIIAEVENRARGIYTGAIGWMNGARAVDLNIAIRTAVYTKGTLYYCSGGGIVADSDCEREFRETETKSIAFLGAVGRPE